MQTFQQEIQNFRNEEELYPYLQSSLLGPLEDFFARPRKDFRGQMIEKGFALGTTLYPHFSKNKATDQKNLEILKDLLESLHSGSLIIDDIQDSSLIRRGQPSLHLKYGIPVALNAGNWLYFFAYRLIEKLEVNESLQLRFYRVVTDTLFAAHCGQALDVGTPIDQLCDEETLKVCQKSLELKSGLLMGLALQLGALLTPVSEPELEAIRKFGIAFGISLQRFDDLGNFNCDRPTAKHLEDLQLRRPSWVWQSLALLGDKFEKEQFKSAVKQLPDSQALEDFLKSSDFKQRSFQLASQELNSVLESLKNDLKLSGVNEVYLAFKKLGEKLTYAYNP